MIIGLVKEIKNHEYRVGLTPSCVAAYRAAGHRVLVESGAGEGAGFEDCEYREAGAEIVKAAAEAWNGAEMVVKVKEPIASEYGYLRKDLILYTYLHLAADRPLTEALLGAGTSGVAYETISDAQGGLPCLAPMSLIAGRMAVAEGAKYLQKTYGGRGVLLAGAPGVERGRVTIIGGGAVGTEACKIAVGLGAEVCILDVRAARLAWIDDIFGSRVQTLHSTPANIRKSIAEADVVVGAVLIPGKKAPKLVARSDLACMKKGSVLVDVAVDQGGCFETTRATTHQDPVFVVDGVVHYCVANMPGAVARTSTLALTGATLSFGLLIAEKGLAAAARENEHLRRGINVHRGACTFEGVAESLGLPCADIEKLLA
ncbi:MAG: alanine dehydrogenase [Clostridiales Family XIII bacterium]|jgi:alanine dehydrogenase|nr:alanine dehydrogenase [Clostridiales Family XIII bacterium]